MFSKLVDGTSREKSKTALYSNVSVDEVAFVCYILCGVFGSILDVFSAITRTQTNDIEDLT